jgi:hypothetical protein
MSIPPAGNGRNAGRLTLEQFADAKGLPAEFLRANAVEETGDGIRFAYLDETGVPIAHKRRTALKAKDGSYWPKGKPLAAYGQWRVDEARRAGLLYIVEGESDTLTLWFHGLPALGIPGAGAAKCLCADHLAGITKAYISREPDRGGPTFVEGVVARLRSLHWQGEAFELTMPDGTKDPNELHLHCKGGGFLDVWQERVQAAPLIQPDERNRTKAQPIRSASKHAASQDDDRPEIQITTEEHEVNAQAVAALTADKHIYQRGGLLVRVVRDTSPAAKGIRRPHAPRLDALPAPILREHLAAKARWYMLRETKEGPVRIPQRPPSWCVSAVHARGEWEGMRHLEAVVDYPVLRPDGTILCTPGYDPETGLLLEPPGELPAIAQHPTLADAQAACAMLLEIVNDFPFAAEIHKAAWLAGLLTPLARFAFAGPAPLFLCDSNVRGAGKGLLLNVQAKIVTGESFTVATYTTDDDELRKRITSLVMEGDRLVLFDNLDGKFGGPVLDAALTATTWKDRLLGFNRTASAPLYMTWYATGNNVMIGADTSRRVCHIRLESPEEKPEERTGFHRPNLLAWVGEHRQKLLAAALCVLRAYFVAGRPDMRLPAWGSYEGWSALVRSTVVWLGLPDPGQTRVVLQDTVDTPAQYMAVILDCLERLDPQRQGLTAAQVVETVKPQKSTTEPAPDWYADLRDAVEGLVGKLDSRLLGYRFRAYRRRVFGGRYLDQAGRSHQAIRWAVFPASSFLAGATNPPRAPHPPGTLGGGWEDGEHVSPPAETSHGGNGRPAGRYLGGL